jgi:hypothetical protein
MDTLATIRQTFEKESMIRSRVMEWDVHIHEDRKGESERGEEQSQEHAHYFL